MGGADDGCVQPLAGGGPVEPGAAEGEDAAVGGDEPIPTTVWLAHKIDDRRHEPLPGQVAVVPRVAVGVDTAAGTDGPVPALAAFLVLWDMREREADESRTIWVPKTKAYQYCVRNDVWHKGVAELADFGCIHRVNGTVVFPAGVNPRVKEARYRVGWRLNHQRLFGLNREQLPA